ncbi:MAG: DUF3320 domain-containing protein [Clostridia bacterium]|nr:DUF3320 domain-containing protein [Clostridia bacterium]
MDNKVVVSAEINSSINFAMQQNYVPVIRSVTVRNESEELLKGLTLKIRSEPRFAKEYTYSIAAVAAGGSVEISPVKIRLLPEYLYSLTEKLAGSMSIGVYSGEECLCECSRDVELLAFDQWSGLRVMPEMITAFVTPNHPRIAEIVSKAGEYLQKWTGSPSFTGYQTENPDNVKLQMAAVYAALRALNIAYTSPLASYEMLGQRIRLPHVVIGQKLGTCLDLSVLYATCLEAVGLYPLIGFKKGHAFAGCRLNEETFADCMVDDISAFEKRLVKGSEELLFVECTDLTAGNNIDFDKAVIHGNANIDDVSEFEGVVDVQRCRGSGIRPIPLRLDRARDVYENDGSEAGFAKLNEKAPKSLEIRRMEDLGAGEEKLTKQCVWERKLLDFSLRNSLLNFRPGKNSLQLMVSDLSGLEDALSDGKNLRVLEAPSDLTLTMRSMKMYDTENEKDIIESMASQEMKNGRVRTFLPAEELNGQLKNMFRSAKVSMEENGTNTMFLALGFLKWFESEISEKPRYSPLVLVPVDIVRSLRSGGYVIRSRQEEARINITLLEYLRQIFSIKITGLDTLPEDEHGIDLPLIFHTVRQAIMEKSRWNLVDMAFIGLFSFGQFVMWNDIRNRADELKQNKVVSSLMDGKMNWTPEELPFDAKNVESVFKPADLAVPLSADSSQLVAVAAASGKRSFVLHGPPGTGKSQTITNMIANALYNGKTVLFAAEKMAALSVVQKRLAAIGLDPFCLELHSNKTSKNVVLSQLNKALEVGRIKAPEEHQAVADRLYNIRTEFNNAIAALHKKREYGCSVYEAIERYEAKVKYKGRISLDRSFTEAVTERNADNFSEAVRRFAVAAAETGPYEQAPWKGCTLDEYSLELRDDLEGKLRETLIVSEKAQRAADILTGTIGIAERSRKVLEELIAIRKAASQDDSAQIFPAVALSDNGEMTAKRINECCAVGEKYNLQYSSLMQDYDESVLSYNTADASMRLRQSEASWILAKSMGLNKLVKELRLYSKNPNAITKEKLSGEYDRINSVLALQQEIGAFSQEMTGYIGGAFSGVKSDWTYIRRAVSYSLTIKTAIDSADHSRKAKYMEGVFYLIKDKSAAAAGADIASFFKLQEFMLEKYRIQLSTPLEMGKDHIAEYIERLNGYSENMDLLKAWTAMQEEKNRLLNFGLACVYNAWEKGTLKESELSDAYEANLYFALILKTLRSDAVLKSFRGSRFEDTIKQYKELTDRFRMLTINELVARLSANVPAGAGNGAASSEIGILKKAIKSNGRMMSIRKLFDQIPNLLRKLCPCMLMSPISVAQYIDPSFPKFDLVIFDEASQLPTSEAVGTIARGENVIVVGDPNQLPPTNFFSTTHSDEDNMELEDLESLLDDCLSISMPQMYLKWHYRSRHESLIAFSNMKYYDNKLFTFPSTNDLRSAVSFVPIEGSYDKGRSKQNRAEAEAVVNEIIRRMQSGDTDSIGVVTFSSVQQNLIDDMLAEAFVKHPELEDRDRSSPEPIFIKNLENVQGDERDVILFSVGYGPDKDGKVSMNFGPLNRDGGWRRLNVAVSRARKQMIVYSTLRPEQIDLSRTRAEGVAGLKAFLEYAQRGKAVLASKAGANVSEIDPLITQIAEELEKQGLEVKCSIGCSEYRIDLGIISPDDPDKYLLVILLDGSNSASSTATDRFILQPGVLGGLGWRIMRVWTMEWLDDKKKVLSMINEEIERCKVQSAEEKAVTVAAAEQTKEIEKLYEQKEETYRSAGTVYKEASIAQLGSSDDFNADLAEKRILTVMSRIIDTEAPISRKALYRKTLAAWGVTRMTAKAESRLDDALSKIDHRTTKDGVNLFYWKADQVPDDYSIYRIEESSGGKRAMDEVSSFEITNAVKEVIDEQISLTRKDLIRETAKKFGYPRLGAVIESTIDFAIDRAKERGIISEDSAGKFSAAAASDG